VVLDFSAVSNMNYYNGVIFQGFISSLPGSVLSGGQYDNLMRRLRRRSGAVGFAVYLDQIERLENLGEEDALC
jgi:ATP phosphoribosyltransferase regulatory subunit